MPHVRNYKVDPDIAEMIVAGVPMDMDDIQKIEWDTGSSEDDYPDGYTDAKELKVYIEGYSGYISVNPDEEYDIELLYQMIVPT